MNDFFKNVQEYIKNSNMTKEEKVAFIKAAGDFYQKQVDREYNNYVRNQYVGAGIEIASAAIPGSAGVNVAKKIAPKILKETIGKNLAENVTAGAINGAMSGGIYGFGEGIAENKNSLYNSAQRATEGLLAGGLAGKVSGELHKIGKAYQLESTKHPNLMNNVERKILREQGKQYYSDYYQGTTQQTPIGNVYFPSSQAGEIGLHNYKMLPKINEQIRNPKTINITNDKPTRKDSNYFYNLGNTYKDKNYIYQIRNNSNNSGNDFYQIKEVGSNPAYSDQPRALELEPINSIKDFLSDFNLPKWVNPQTATLGQTINSNIQDNIPNFDFNTAVTTRGNSQQTQKYDKIFTPEDIGQMTPEEFSKNEKTINEQLQQGLIAPTTQRKQNYSGYRNPVSGDNRIFSQEDIGNFSGEEFTKHEKEIRGQWGSIGIPTNNELQTSGAIYIAPYIRSDGVQVKGHYRSR